MSYSIYIGNAVPHFEKDDDYLLAEWRVQLASHPDAPTFPHDTLTGNSNSRHPSYSGWANFCDAAGLADLFRDKYTGLMREHPGCQLLKESHYHVVKEALDRWKASSDKPPGFADDKIVDGKWTLVDKDKYDPILARLIWLEWWMRWALDNCETPAIFNH